MTVDKCVVNIFGSRPFNEMFAFNFKSHCCNSTFTDAHFTVSKNIQQIDLLFFDVQHQHFSNLKLSFILVNFSRKQRETFREHTEYLLRLDSVQQFTGDQTERRGAWADCGPAQAASRCTKCNSPPNSGRCTNFILFDVALCPLNG